MSFRSSSSSSHSFITNSNPSTGEVRSVTEISSSSSSSSASFHAPSFGKLIQFLVGWLVAVCLIRVLAGSAPPSFQSLLEGLSNCPQIDISWVQKIPEIPDSGIAFIDWITDFFNGLVKIGALSGTAAINIIPFIIYMYSWVFAI